jgi:uncharacterized protein (TIGR02147 family)
VKINSLASVSPRTSADSFRLYLQAELGRRCARSKGYSLRAFAKYLAIDHASLSQLLRGKRRLTAQTIKRLGTRLGLGQPAIDTYVAAEARMGSARESAAVLREVRQLAQNTASLIADWHHYALLELTRLQEFRPDTGWIARVLGISQDEVNIALQRLLRLGLLEMTEHGRWVDKSGDSTASLAEFNQVVIERLTEQVRRLLLDALKCAPAGRVAHSSTTLAVHTAHLPAVIDRINQFQRELVALLDQDEMCDDVYRLEISLFPLTTLQRQEENEHGTACDAVADCGT